jgi:prolyl oligopeptidase
MTTTLVSLLVVVTAAAPRPDLPATPKRPVADTYHGVTVSDDYQWLEDGSAPEVKSWTEAQNAVARAHLDGLPGRQALRRRISAIMSYEAPSYDRLTERGGRIFAVKRQPPAQQAMIVLLKSLDDLTSERVVYDPNKEDPTASTYFDWYVPSDDGRLLALSISRAGSEDGTLHILDVDSGKMLPDRIPRVQYPTAGGDVAWKADGSGLWYTRFPAPGERQGRDQYFFQQVWWHKLGTPVSQDRYVFGKDQPRIAANDLTTSRDGKWVLVRVANGDGGEAAFYLASAATPDAPWRQVAAFADKVFDADFGPDGALYLLSRRDAPRGKILRLAPGKTVLAEATQVVPQGRGVILDYEVTDSRIWLAEMEGGPTQLRSQPLAGGTGTLVTTLPVPSVYGLERLGGGDTIVFSNASYLQPPGFYTIAGGQESPRKTALQKRSLVSFADSEVLTVFATSKDGTKVPLTIIKRKGTRLHGNNPTLLTGYGGYGISQRPAFQENRRVWIEGGGVLAIAALRGGGEYGEEWHEAGKLTRKQNVFDDFAACAKWLIDNKYTRSSRLAVMGGSNGGLLMGAFLTQHPGLARAVVSLVGVYDMVRYERSPNGEFNTTEFGSVKDPAQFQALHAYSPYHQVKDGVQYPAILLTAGANDGRVDPANSRKMAARLQASGTRRPVLLRTSAESGHGIGTSLSQRIEENVDVFAFLFSELGMKPGKDTVRQGARSPRPPRAAAP